MTADPYNLAEYTSQSAAEAPSRPIRDPAKDVRGNTVCVPRSIPTQQEADAIKWRT